MKGHDQQNIKMSTELLKTVTKEFLCINNKSLKSKICPEEKRIIIPFPKHLEMPYFGVLIKHKRPCCGASE